MYSFSVYYKNGRTTGCLLLLPAEEVAQAVEVFLHDDAYALGVQEERVK